MQNFVLVEYVLSKLIDDNLHGIGNCRISGMGYRLSVTTSTLSGGCHGDDSWLGECNVTFTIGFLLVEEHLVSWLILGIYIYIYISSVIVYRYIDGSVYSMLNTMRPRHNGCHFANDIVKCTVWKCIYYDWNFTEMYLFPKAWLMIIYYLNQWWFSLQSHGLALMSKYDIIAIWLYQPLGWFVKGNMKFILFSLFSNTENTQMQ